MPRVPGGKPSPRERNRITPQRRFDFEAGEVRWFEEVLKTAPLPEYWLQRELYDQQVQAYMQMGPTYAGIERSTEPAFRAQGPTVAGEPITIERTRRGAARSMRRTHTFQTITGRHVPPLDVQRLGPDDVHYASRGGRGAEPARAISAFHTEEMRALELAIMERIAEQERRQSWQREDGFGNTIYFLDPEKWT